MPENPPTAQVTARGVRRLKASHPWVYRDDVRSLQGSHGDLVRVLGPGGRCLGVAFLSLKSKIALRLVLPEVEAVPDDHWSGVVDRALAHRDAVRAPDTDAERLLFGESDGIPGLVADRYGAHLVLQVLTAGAERILDTVVHALRERIPLETILLRNDPAVRALEGLDREVRPLAGRTPERLEVREHGITFVVDPWKGQKTGMFLDQRDNHATVGALARGSVLDVFSYQGGFGLHADAAALL